MKEAIIAENNIKKLHYFRYLQESKTLFIKTLHWKCPMLCGEHGSNIRIAGSSCTMERQKTAKLNGNFLTANAVVYS